MVGILIVFGLKNRLHPKDKVKNKKIIIIPRATHLFEEPGTLEQVASIASNWFLNYLREILRIIIDSKFRCNLISIAEGVLMPPPLE